MYLILLLTFVSLNGMFDHFSTKNKIITNPHACNFHARYTELHDKYTKKDSTLNDLVQLFSYLKSVSNDSKYFVDESEQMMYKTYADSLEYLYWGIKIMAIQVYCKRHNLVYKLPHEQRQKWFSLVHIFSQVDNDFHAKLNHYVNNEYRQLPVYQAYNEI